MDDHVLDTVRQRLDRAREAIGHLPINTAKRAFQPVPVVPPQVARVPSRRVRPVRAWSRLVRI